MEVIGRGFIAGNLAGIAARHPSVVAIAAGVSSTVVESAEAFDREATVVRDTLRSAGRTGRLVVFFSTASKAMYPAPGSGTEDAPAAPVSAYGRHKLRLENMVRDSGVPALIVRLTHLVGADQRPHQLFPSLVAQVRSGTVRLRTGARRDLIDVRHLVAILDRLLDLDVSGHTINLGSGVAWPVTHIVAGIERRLGVTANRIVAGAEPPGSLVSIAKLRGLVDLDRFGFDTAYPNTLLDTYLQPITTDSASRIH